MTQEEKDKLIEVTLSRLLDELLDPEPNVEAIALAACRIAGMASKLLSFVSRDTLKCAMVFKKDRQIYLSYDKQLYRAELDDGSPLKDIFKEHFTQ